MRNEMSVLFHVLFTSLMAIVLFFATACGGGGDGTSTGMEAEAEAEAEGQEAESEGQEAVAESESEAELCPAYLNANLTYEEMTYTLSFRNTITEGLTTCPRADSLYGGLAVNCWFVNDQENWRHIIAIQGGYTDAQFVDLHTFDTSYTGPGDYRMPFVEFEDPTVLIDLNGESYPLKIGAVGEGGSDYTEGSVIFEEGAEGVRHFSFHATALCLRSFGSGGGWCVEGAPSTGILDGEGICPPL